MQKNKHPLIFASSVLIITIKIMGNNMRFHQAHTAHNPLEIARNTIQQFLDRNLTPFRSARNAGNKLPLPSVAIIESVINLPIEDYRKVLNVASYLVLLAKAYPSCSSTILERTLSEPDEFNRVIQDASDLISFLKAFQSHPLAIDRIMAKANSSALRSEGDVELLRSTANTLSLKHGEDAVRPIHTFIGRAEQDLAARLESLTMRA